MQQWIEIGGEVEGDWIKAEVDHFTKFAVFSVATEVPDEKVELLEDMKGHWAEEQLLEALQLGIVQGYQDLTFRPDVAITRAEFAVMLTNAFGLDGDAEATHFSDQDKIGSWAASSIAQAFAAGIIQGYQDGSFQPDKLITRAEVVTMAGRALGLNVDSDASTNFSDDADIPIWAKGYADFAAQTGVIQGRGNNRFVPNDSATRAEAVTIIINTLRQVN